MAAYNFINRFTMKTFTTTLAILALAANVFAKGSPGPPNAPAQGGRRAPDSDATSDGWPIAFVVASRLMITALASQ